MSLCWGAGLQCFKTFLFEELCSILLSHEARLEQQATAEAQAAYEANVTMKHKCGMNEKKEGHGKGYNPNQGPGKSHGGRGSNNNSLRGRGRGRYGGKKTVFKPDVTCHILLQSWLHYR